MPLLTDLANAIRKDEPKNLFCLVEFGDHGIILVASSGKGWRPKGTHISLVERRPNAQRVRYINDKSGQNADGEERLFREFDRWYKEFGNETPYLTVITAASPCNRICAGTIREVAETYKDRIVNWVVLFHAYYQPDEESGSIDEVMSKLMNEENPKMICGMLHSTFVDPSTRHNRGK